MSVLTWTRYADGWHNGRPTYQYCASIGDREYTVVWSCDRGFGYTAGWRKPHGRYEYLTETHGIIWAGTLKRCKWQCDAIERKHSGS